MDMRRGWICDLNYTHYYQALTDPLGANFNEVISYLITQTGAGMGCWKNVYTVRGENPGVGYNNR
jgi:hypothetical protein